MLLDETKMTVCGELLLSDLTLIGPTKNSETPQYTSRQTDAVTALNLNLFQQKQCVIMGKADVTLPIPTEWFLWVCFQCPSRLVQTFNAG